MRRFAFKLEKVLELRRYAEREWEIKLAQATSRVIEVEREVGAWTRRRGETTAIRMNLGPVDVELFQGREDYVGLIDQRVAALNHRLVALEAEREKVRRGYLEASRRRKALSKLKERREDEYYHEALREETRTIDEIAGTQTVERIRKSEEADV